MTRLGIDVSVVALACCWYATGCAADEIDIHDVGRLDYAGRVERIETLGRYSASEAALLFNLSGVRSKMAAENAYFLYRVTYSTHGVQDEAERVSGLLAVPATRKIKGVVSWQHGTNTYRPESISKPSLPEGLGLAAVFAGDGYILAAADYVGLGVSTSPQAYYHWPSTVNAVIDLISIAEIVLEGVADAPDHDLYLAGFSQGGGASAAVQRALEETNPTGLELRATATLAAAFSPRWVSIHSVFKYSSTVYFSLVVNSFAKIYGGSLSDVVKAPYSERLPVWLDGTRNGAWLAEHLPKRIEDLATESFIQAYKAGIAEPKWLYDGLEAAETANFAPKAPLRIHFGEDDTDVVPAEAHNGFARMRELGGNVQLFNLGPNRHETTVVAALPYVQQWFDSLERQAR